MSEVIISTPLAQPPRGADRLSSKGNLLVVWRWAGYVLDKDSMEHHFAIHSPTWGWRGCRWDAQPGEASRILPATQDTIWVYAYPYRLMYLKIRQNSEVAVINTDVEVRGLFHANEQGILVKTRDSKISLLRFGEDDGQLCKIDLCYGIDPSWAQFLSDKAIAIYDSEQLIVVSPEGNKVYEEKVSRCDNYPPFIIHDDADCLYYTDDPRKEWHKSDALKVIRARIGSSAGVKFFTAIGNEYYIASNDSRGNVHLHCLSPQSHDRQRCVWEIKPASHYEFARHDRFICITSACPLSGYGDTSPPKNNGFLVWDPARNAFHTDVPHTMNIPKISVGRIPTVVIPDIWGQGIRQR